MMNICIIHKIQENRMKSKLEIMCRNMSTIKGFIKWGCLLNSINTIDIDFYDNQEFEKFVTGLPYKVLNSAYSFYCKFVVIKCLEKNRSTTIGLFLEELDKLYDYSININDIDSLQGRILTITGYGYICYTSLDYRTNSASTEYFRLEDFRRVLLLESDIMLEKVLCKLSISIDILKLERHLEEQDDCVEMGISDSIRLSLLSDIYDAEYEVSL